MRYVAAVFVLVAGCIGTPSPDADVSYDGGDTTVHRDPNTPFSRFHECLVEMCRDRAEYCKSDDCVTFPGRGDKQKCAFATSIGEIKKYCRAYPDEHLVAECVRRAEQCDALVDGGGM